MSKATLIDNMKKTLDWTAKEYEKYTDEEVKDAIAKEFKIEASAYNQLLQDMYTTIKGYELFTRRIETYLITRKCEDWR